MHTCKPWTQNIQYSVRHRNSYEHKSMNDYLESYEQHTYSNNFYSTANTFTNFNRKNSPWALLDTQTYFQNNEYNTIMIIYSKLV